MLRLIDVAYHNVLGQDSPSIHCGIGDLLNIFEGNVADYHGPYNDVTWTAEHIQYMCSMQQEKNLRRRNKWVIFMWRSIIGLVHTKISSFDIHDRSVVYVPLAHQ